MRPAKVEVRQPVVCWRGNRERSPVKADAMSYQDYVRARACCASDILDGVSRGSVEVVRRIYEDRDRLVGSRGADLIRELFDPEVRLDMSRRTFNPAVYEGYAGLQQWAQDVGEVWKTFEETVERYVDAGERIAVVARRRGKGRESGVYVEDRSASVWTLRAGRVIHVETELDPEDALRSVGA
jgi:ketosteroid isomerase-like protein